MQLLDIPAATPNDPRAQIYNSDFIQSVCIHPGAATIDDGNFLGGNDPAVNDLTTWTAVDQPQLSLHERNCQPLTDPARATLPQRGPIRARRFVFDSHVCPVIVRFQGTTARTVP